MSSNPFAGHVPLHLRKADQGETIAKSTSFRPGIIHRSEYRTPQQKPEQMRNEGCTPLRRYPDGRLDVKYVAHHVIDVVHKAENGGVLTNYEKALLSSILPGKFQLVDQKIAATMARMTDEERMLVALTVLKHFHEELNWNAGRGGGSVPLRNVTRS